MEINLLFFLTVIPAIILYGIAKSGLGGSMTLISVPLMTIVMPLNQALGIILPILIFSDFIAVYKYRKEFDLGTLKLMVPFAAIGIIIGSLTFSYFSEDLLKFIIGLMGFLFAGHYFFFKKNKETKSEKNFNRLRPPPFMRIIPKKSVRCQRSPGSRYIIFHTSLTFTSPKIMQGSN